MKPIQKINRSAKVFGVFMWSLIIIAMASCRKVDLVTTTSDDANIYSYFAKYPEKFSMFSKVLEMTNNAGFLDAYGNYTIFAPDNDAINKFLQQRGASSIESIPQDEWKDLVRIHLIEDTLSTLNFTDGKIRNVTMYGQFLISGASNENGITKYIINRRSQIIQPDIRVGNGMIHVVNTVIEPARLTVAEVVAENPNYSIFTEALRATGLYDTLMLAPSKITNFRRQYVSLLAESNAVLAAEGIHSFQDLYDKYSHSKNPKLKTDSLNIFVRYHIIEEAKYLGDIVSSQTHSTFVPLEVLTAKLQGQTILINDDFYNDIHEIGFELTRQNSDVTAINGVVHDASAHFNVKVRRPFPIYWDLADFPEMRRLTQYYGRASYDFPQIQPDELQDIKFQSRVSNMKYFYSSGSGANLAYNKDILQVPMGAVSRTNWAEFRSPVLIKGTYRVWVCYFRQQQSSSAPIHRYQITVDGKVMPRQVDFGSGMPDPRTVTNTEEVLEALNYKNYMFDRTSSNARFTVGRNVGIVEVETTGRIWVRFTALPGTAAGTNSQNTNNLDMIQFIPVDANQLYPVFDVNGNIFNSR